ncbi:MAG: hypothetical protein MJK04_31355, partial [Psychrosphaera sp.]|nr:hypothetical protein [Psychrosphaera sp.]
MDIWQWVYDVQAQLRVNGDTALLEAMDSISSLTCDDQHDKVDVMYPMALSLARKHDNPWIEVYMRHWYLQSQVLHRHNAKGMISEAIDLLEFSSKDNTKDCPQSICVVQDLASCYGKSDGPGFVEER